MAGRWSGPGLIFRQLPDSGSYQRIGTPYSARLTVLGAGEGGQFANEYRDRSHRLFSYFLIRGLLDGKTAWPDLYQYVRQDVDAASRSRGAAYTQTPVLRGNGQGQVP